MKKEHWILISIAIILAMAIGALLMLYFQKPSIVTNPVPVYIQGKDSIIIKEYHHYHKEETKAEVNNDTARTTILGTYITDEQDTLRYKTHVEYLLLDSAFSVAHDFNLIKAKPFRVDTLKITIPVETVKPYEWYQEPYLHFGLGVLVSLLLVLLGG